jgi:hypothetical protein
MARTLCLSLIYLVSTFALLFPFAPQVPADDVPPAGNPKDKKEPAPNTATAFPLAKGLKWETQLTGGTRAAKMENKTRIFQVKDVVVLHGFACYEVFESFGDGSTDEISYLAADKNGWNLVFRKAMTLQDGKRKLGFTVKWDPPKCFVKPPQKEVQKWSWEGSAKYDFFTEKEVISGTPEKTKHSFLQYSDTVKVGGKEIEAVVVVEEIEKFDESTGKWRLRDKQQKSYAPGKGLVKWAIWDLAERQREFSREPSYIWETTSFTGGNTLTIGKVILNEKPIEKEGKVDIVESEVGGETTYTKSRTIRREINYSVKIGLDAETEAKLGASILAASAELTGRIKASIAGELGEKWTDEITETAAHKINLDKNPKVKVVWLDIYRTGSVQVAQDGKTFTVPFEFPVATRTVLKAVK